MKQDKAICVKQAKDYVVPKRDNPVVSVFCGSSPGTSASHLAAARELAWVFHQQNVTLVYGGGTCGVMGEIARTLVDLSGPESVIGIIPTALVKYEQSSKIPAVSELPEASIYGREILVNSMHTRKHLMADHVLAGGKGSGFVALSGGFGTLEEIMEIATWSQLGIHGQGVVIYNVEEYWDGLLLWIQNAITAGFVSSPNGGIIKEAKTAEEVFRYLRDYVAPEGRLALNWDIDE